MAITEGELFFATKAIVTKANVAKPNSSLDDNLDPLIPILLPKPLEPKTFKQVKNSL